MGAQNQKTASPEQSQPVGYEQPAQQNYKITVEKLLPSLISKGKRPFTSNQNQNPSEQNVAINTNEENSRRSLTSMTKRGGNYPQSCVGYIQTEVQGKTIITGSAFLIHRQLVLTLAHNCLNANLKPYDKLYFCIKRHTQVLKINVINTRIQEGFLEEEGLVRNQNYLDFAVLYLDKSMEHVNGYVGLAFESDRIDPNSTITLMGYSGDYRPEIKRIQTKFTALGSKLLNLSVQLDESMLGGPVFAQVNGQYYAVGMGLWSGREGTSKAIRFYKYIYDKLNTNYSKKVGFLNLMYHWLSNETMEKVMRQKYALVTDLILEGNRIGPAGVEHLVKANWSQLRLINLANNNIQDAGFERLTHGNWPRLNKLMVGNNAITAVGLVFVKNSNWSQLRHLSVQQNKIRNLGVDALIKGPWANLFTLNLYQTSINWEALKNLVSADYSLQSLDIGENRIREEGFKWLAKGDWPDLNTLNVSQACINDAAIGYLLQNNWLDLKILDLSKNYLTQAGLQQLFKCRWRSLRDLNLRDNKIAIISSDLSSADWKELEEVDLRWNNIAEGQRLALKDNLGKSFPKIYRVFT